MSQLFEYIKKIVSSDNNDGNNNSSPSPIVDLDKANTVTEFNQQASQLVDRIVADLLKSIMASSSNSTNSGSSASKTATILELLDSRKCVETAVYLSNLMENKFHTVSVSGVENEVKVSKKPSDVAAKCANNSNCDRVVKEAVVNLDRQGRKISKKQMCQILASHYVKILNMVASVLAAINPDTNAVMARMRNLYTLVDNGRTVRVGICTPTGKRLVHTNILDEPGFKEFMQLYLFHLMQDTETQESRDAALDDYQQLVEIFTNAEVLDDVPLTESTKSTNKFGLSNSPSNNNVASASPDDLRAMVLKLKARVEKLDHANNNNEVTETKLHNEVKQLRAEVTRLSTQLANNNNTNANADMNGNINANGDINGNTNANADMNGNNNANADMNGNTNANADMNGNTNANADMNGNNNANADINGNNNGDINNEDINNTNTDTNTNISNNENETNDLDTENNNSPSAEELENLKEDIKNMLEDPSTFENVSPGLKKQKGSGRRSLDRFQIFMNKYSKDNADIRKAYLALFSKAFRASSNAVDRVCDAAKSSGRNIHIPVSTASRDVNLKSFIDNYDSMKSEYVQHSRELVNILESRLLQWDSKIGYRIRDIDSQELISTEQQIRKALAELYADGHRRYLAGVKALDKHYLSKLNSD